MKSILLLHGALGSSKQFEPCIELLHSHFHIHTLDLPQHGLNKDICEHTITHYADYVIAYIEQLNTKPLGIFGYSMGGYIALMIAHKRPDLIEKVMTLATKFIWDDEQSKKQLSQLNPIKMAEKIPAYTTYLKSLHQAISWQENVKNTYHVIENLIEVQPLQTHILQEITIPCRLGIGDRDTMVSMQETIAAYKAISTGSFYVLPDTIHPIEKVNPLFIAQQCIDFFKS